MKKLLTLSTTFTDTHVLLGMKKQGFGQGRWNGFGGKVESGETIVQAAQRELHEEVGLVADALEQRGILTFSFANNTDVLQVHVFKVLSYSGESVETEEMKPQWFLHEEIPYDDMWQDDIFWLPLYLQNKKFVGKFHFDSNDALLEQELREVEDLDL